MAVVTVNGPLYMAAAKSTDPVADGRADIRFAGGRVHASVETFTVAVGDSATSKYFVARLPKEAVLLPSSILDMDGGLTGASATMHLGDANDVDNLITSYAGTANTALDFRGWTTGTVANAGKKLWERLGYATAAAAPVLIDLFVTLNVADQVTTAAVGLVQIDYTID